MQSNRFHFGLKMRIVAVVLLTWAIAPWAPAQILAPKPQAPVSKGGTGPTTFKRSPMPVYMGVHQNAGQSLVVTGNGFAAGAPLHWQDRSRNSPHGGHWVVTPLNNSLARIDWCIGNDFYGLQAVGVNQPLQCFVGNTMPSQLWRLQRFPGYSKNFLLESLMYPGYCATFYQDNLFLMPIEFAPAQQFWFDRPPSLVLPPVFRNTTQRIEPNPPLPPAQVHLINQSQEKLIAVVAELQNPANPLEVEIPAGGKTTIEVQRDAGSTIYETYQVSVGGNWTQRQRTYEIPPATLYDVSIYEVFLQSIAIDRTGTSPNAIEDVNYQPRSIGMFQIPPGNQIPELAAIDVMDGARKSNNPGGVRPLPSKMKNAVSSGDRASDPLKKILDEVQSRRKSF